MGNGSLFTSFPTVFYFIGNSFGLPQNKNQLSQGLPQRSEGTAAEKKYTAKVVLIFHAHGPFKLNDIRPLKHCSKNIGMV